MFWALACLPVSTAEAERQFSKVNRTLNALRSTTSEDRLEALVLIEAYRDNLPKTNEILDYFALSHSRKLKFGLEI